MSLPLKDLIIKHDFHFNKRYGQNFISDNNLLDAIVEDAQITEEDTVLEIGAGAGTLTKRLSCKAKKVVSYEIDKNLVGILYENLAEVSNVELRFMDFMKDDPKKLREEFKDAKVVANLPYYITTPVIMRLLEDGIGQSITVMVQKEVADRLSAEPSTKDYSAITVKVKMLGGAVTTRKVLRNMFYPMPNVDSAVIRINRNPIYLGVNEKYTDKVVKTSFLMRRKTLVNNLVGLGFTKEELADTLTDMGIDVNARGETLSPEQFVDLSDRLYAKKS